MSLERMWADEKLEEISAGLMEVQETLEIIEEAAEHELRTLEDRQEWARRSCIPFRTNDLEGVKLLLERTDSALAELAIIQEEIADELDVTPE